MKITKITPQKKEWDICPLKRSNEHFLWWDFPIDSSFYFLPTPFNSFILFQIQSYFNHSNFFQLFLLYSELSTPSNSYQRFYLVPTLKLKYKIFQIFPTQFSLLSTPLKIQLKMFHLKEHTLNINLPSDKISHY